jgi:cellulose synthase/poly-beta-1,6-N-acetylglucosamine synthase-like glycosyltransferase
VDAYDVAVITVQTIVGLGTSLALIHFTILMLTRARGGELPRRPPDRPLHYAFVVPSLNEELVIAATVERLLGLPGDVSVYVVDDASNDGTADIVRALAAKDGRVRLVQRHLPDARQGKGRALNAGFRQLVQDVQALDRDPATVVLCVMDADGMLDAHAIAAVEGLFGHPEVGAAQIGVRIANRRTLIGKLQDVEFYVFAGLIQQGRNHLRSVGLGGNGQFTRLSALLSLDGDPWNDCLTEDLDLGLRLLVKDWRLTFTDRAAVHQQGLEGFGRLLRQRARWVQGHFQCWRHIPAILRMRAPWYTFVDLVFHLTWPVVSLLILPIALIAGWVIVGFQVATLDLSPWQWVGGLAVAYVLAFMTLYFFGFHYRAKSRDVSLRHTLGLVHLLAVYQFVWAMAGWWSMLRIARRRRNWTKTDRLALPAETEPAAG